MKIKIPRAEFERQMKKRTMEENYFGSSLPYVILEGTMFDEREITSDLDKKFPLVGDVLSATQYKVFRELYARKGYKVSTFVIKSIVSTHPNYIIRALRKKLREHHLPFTIITRRMYNDDAETSGYILQQFL